jgi:hypothetical protein
MVQNNKKPHLQQGSAVSKSYLFASVGNGDIHAATFAVKLHFAIDERKERVITAHADVDAGMNFGAALANDDVASDNRLTAEFLHAETFTAGIATVLDGALSFFVGHGGEVGIGG